MPLLKTPYYTSSKKHYVQQWMVCHYFFPFRRTEEAEENFLSSALEFYLEHQKEDAVWPRPPAGLYSAAAAKSKGPNPSQRYL